MRYLNVVWKNNLPGRRGDSEVIECAAFAGFAGRLNFYREATDDGRPKGALPFLSIAEDQVMLWEVVDSPEDVKLPAPDQLLRLPVLEDTAALLRRGGYLCGRDSAETYWVELPIFFKKE